MADLIERNASVSAVLQDGDELEQSEQTQVLPHGTYCFN